MFGLQTLLTSSLASTLTYALIGIAIIGVVYFFYKRHQQQQSEQNQHTEFEPVRHERAKRLEKIQNHSTNSLDLQKNADQILQAIQQQQTHLETLIGEFGTTLQTIQSIDVELGQANHNLRDKIITPFEGLIKKMQVQYHDMHQQLLNLSSAFIETNRTIIQREKELSQIVDNLKSIESNAHTGVSQLQTGLASIANIRSSIERKTRENKAIKEKNTDLTKHLKELTRKFKTLSEINDLQQRRIEELESSHTELDEPSSQSDRRATLPPSNKFFNRQYSDQPCIKQHHVPLKKAGY